MILVAHGPRRIVQGARGIMIIIYLATTERSNFCDVLSESAPFILNAFNERSLA